MTKKIITGFLKTAARCGWHMRHDHITPKMAAAYGAEARAGPLDCNKQCCFDHKAWKAALAVAPKFEVD